MSLFARARLLACQRWGVERRGTQPGDLHKWVERVEAYDLEMDRRRSAERERLRGQIDELTLSAGSAMLTDSLSRFQGSEDGSVSPVDWNEVSPSEARQIAVDGARLSRAALGLSLDISKAQDTLTYAQVEAMLGEFLAYAMARIPDDQQEGFLRDVRSIRPPRR